MKHFYAIPTHREIDDINLAGYFSEVEYARKKLNKDVYLVIFEDTNDNINRKKIIDFKEKYIEVPVVYINRKNVVEIYDYIKKQLPSKVLKTFDLLYPNSNVNYGNVFNRIFIFSMLYGVNYIHRRDSDILIDVADGKAVYPIENEVKYLSKVKNKKVVYILGGGYKGKYNLDIDSLILENDDYSLVKKLFSCMSIPEEHHDDIVNEEILGNNALFTGDVISFDSRSYPECGNISIYKLHEYFPSPSQDFILGSDYFFIDVSVHTKLNVTYHNRAVIHKHTKDRTVNIQKIFNYWYGFLMLIDSQIFYRNFYEKYLDRKDYNGKINYEHNPSKQIAREMKTFVCDFKKTYKDMRIRKIKECISILMQSNDENLKTVAKRLAGEYLNIVNITNKEIDNHINLIKYWPYIVSTIKKTKKEKNIKNLLESFLLN